MAAVDGEQFGSEVPAKLRMKGPSFRAQDYRFNAVILLLLSAGTGVCLLLYANKGNVCSWGVAVLSLVVQVIHGTTALLWRSTPSTVRIGLKVVTQVLVIWSLAFVLSYKLLDGPLASFGIDSVVGGVYKIAPKDTYEYETENMARVPEGAPYNVGELHILTGGSGPYFGRTLNVVASIQHFEPGHRIYVYDLGFTSEQRRLLSCLVDVRLLTFNFSNYPPHVTTLANYAWKLFVMNDHMEDPQFGMKDNDVVMWVDGGLEVSAPFIDRVTERLRRHGHMAATQARFEKKDWDAVMHTPAVEEALGTFKDEDGRGSRYCAGGLEGFVRGSEAHKLILKVAKRCAMSAACTTTMPSFDQGMFTSLIRRHGFACDRKDLFLQNAMEKMGTDHRLPSNHYYFLARRGRLPLPYRNMAKIDDKCEVNAEDAPRFAGLADKSVERLHSAALNRRPISSKHMVWSSVAKVGREAHFWSILFSMGFGLLFLVSTASLDALLSYSTKCRTPYNISYIIAKVRKPVAKVDLESTATTSSNNNGRLARLDSDDSERQGQREREDRTVPMIRHRVLLALAFVHVWTMVFLYLQTHYALFM